MGEPPQTTASVQVIFPLPSLLEDTPSQLQEEDRAYKSLANSYNSSSFLPLQPMVFLAKEEVPMKISPSQQWGR